MINLKDCNLFDKEGNHLGVLRTVHRVQGDRGIVGFNGEVWEVVTAGRDARLTTLWGRGKIVNHRPVLYPKGAK